MFAYKSPKEKPQITNPNLLRLRLTTQEKTYYTRLFDSQASGDGTVSSQNFPKLLGVFGTDIAEDFALRIFNIFSSHHDYIILSEYLRYVDVYHYGDESERCKVTCRLMDVNDKRHINLEDFSSYINMIISSARKVNPGLKKDLFNETDIKVLFNKISDNKIFFTYEQFANVYHEKPEILSWVDYFKNDSNEVLLSMHQFIKELIKILFSYNYQLYENIKDYRKNKEEVDKNANSVNGFMSKIKDLIINFEKEINRENRYFMNIAKSNQFTMRSLFNRLNEYGEEDSSISEEEDELTYSNYLKNNYNNIENTNDININTNMENMISENCEFLLKNIDSTPNFTNSNNNNLQSKQGKTVTEKYNFNGTKSSKCHELRISNFFDYVKKRINNSNDDSDIQPPNIDDVGEFEENDSSLETSIVYTIRKNKKANTNNNTYNKFIINNEDIIDENTNENINENLYENNIENIDITNLKKNIFNYDSQSMQDIYDTNEEVNSQYVKNIEKLQECQNIIGPKFNLRKKKHFKEDSKVNEHIICTNITNNNLSKLIKNVQIKSPKKSKHSRNFTFKTERKEKSSFSNELNNDDLHNFMKMNKQNKQNISLSNEKSSTKNIKTPAKYFNSILKCLEHFTKYIFKSIQNLDECYKFIEKKYLKSDLKKLFKAKEEKNKKKEAIRKKSKLLQLKKTNKFSNINNNSDNDDLNDLQEESQFPLENIPKNKLKTTDYSFKILLNTIMGIQIAVENTENVTEINDNIEQYCTSMTHTIQTVNLSKNKLEIFFLKDFAGVVFNNIRKMYGYDKENFIQSISPQDFITNMMISNIANIEELFSTGSSGALFYNTRDGKFILKTIKKKEYKTFKRILPGYFLHLKKYKHSLLPKYFGCYKLIRKFKKKKEKMYFLLMTNIFSTSRTIHARFDLKGSKIGRTQLGENILQNNIEEIYGKYSYALKDLDLDHFNKVFFLQNNLRIQMVEQLNHDTMFLRDCNLNDYSLLVGIHKIGFMNNNGIADEEQSSNMELNQKMKYLSLRHANKNFSLNKENNYISNGMSEREFENNEVRIELADFSNRNFNNDENVNNKNNMTFNQNFKKNYMNFENESLTNENNEFEINTETKNIHKQFSFSRKRFSIYSDDNNKFKSFHSSARKTYTNSDELREQIVLKDGGILSEKNQEIYYIGIIDILTEFNVKKNLEYFYKMVRYCSKDMSCVPPALYQSRFMHYIRTKLQGRLETESLDPIDPKFLM